MPTVKVCLWNIQNFGFGDVARKWDSNSNLRNRFIKDFVRSQKIDVLLMMEMAEGGRRSLSDLLSTLNMGRDSTLTDWAVSYCGSALSKRATNPPTNASQVMFKTGARTEGYAVAWRTAQTSPFTLVPALHPIAAYIAYNHRRLEPAQPLNVTTSGRLADNVDEDNEWRPKGGYTTANLCPYDGDTLLDEWPKLEFPGTGKYDSQMRWDRARRPAYVVLKLKIDGATDKQRLCPIGVYHAPSKLQRAELGALQGGLSRELYVANTLNDDGTPKADGLVHSDRAVLGGDFNYEVAQADWPGYYGYFTSKYRKAYTGGAACSVAPPSNATENRRQTVIRLLKGAQHDEEITGVEITDYLSHMIDLVFFRGAGVSAARVNIPALLIDPLENGPYGSTLKMFRTHLNRLVNNLGVNQQLDALKGPQERQDVGTPDERWVPMLSGSWGGSFRNWPAFMTQLEAGKLTAARQAAEFYQIFVSDHLPLVVTIAF
jgi:hypothetical protein